MRRPAVVVFLLLLLPLLGTCQHFKANYLCDFETSDCGFHALSDTGAYFSRGSVDFVQKKTYALVLGDLPSGGNWTKTRTAYVQSPAIFPSSLFGKVSVSLDYFLEDRNCVDYLQLGHLVDGTVRALAKGHDKSSWKTIKGTVQETDQPIQLVVEAHLRDTCKDSKTCHCSRSAAVDNLRISSSDVTTSKLNQEKVAERHGAGQDHHQFTDPELSLAAMDVAFQDLQHHNRKALESDQDDDLDEVHIRPLNSLEQTDVAPYPRQLECPFSSTPRDPLSPVRPGTCPPPPPPPPPSGKRVPQPPPPRCFLPPPCPVEVRFPEECSPAVVKVCEYLTPPNSCQCVYTGGCARMQCPIIEPCPPPPVCPVPPPVDIKTWGKQDWSGRGNII